MPLEPIYDELPPEEWAVVKAHLQQRVKDRGLWGAFLDPEARRRPASASSSWP